MIDGTDRVALERALCRDLGMFVADPFTFQFAGYIHEERLCMLKPRPKRLCHIFHNFFKIDVDRFVRWGLYTGTTRAGRRWRLPNAPYSLVDWFACGLVD